MRRTLIALVALATLALPASALATTQVALGSGVVARLSYQGRLPHFTHVSLSIKRDGKQVYQHPITSRYCGEDCQLSIVPSQKAVQVVNFAQSGEPDVLVSLFTGGAHCCSVAQVFTYDAKSKSYAMAEHNFGDPGYRLERLSSDGAREFVTADDAFAYTFTDFADSGLPVKVLRLQGHSFDNVTGQFPGLVKVDARQWLRDFHRMARTHYQNTVGVIAAWAADEYTLGRVKQAKAFLVTQARAGHLNAALAPKSDGGLGFVKKLEKFLRTRGYVPVS